MRRLANIFILIFAAVYIFSGICFAQENAIRTDKESIKKLRDIVKEEMKRWNSPGLSVGVIRDGKLIFAEGFGYRDMDKKLEVTPNTNFILASVTKAFTVMTIGLLIDEGKMDWDSPIKKYFPDFRLSDEYIEENLTVRDILCHRSGLPRHDYVWFNSPFSVEEIVNRLQYLEFSAGLREKYQYNNLMFMTAGYLAGKVAGTEWGQLVKEKIFKPLEMSESGCSVEELLSSDNYSFSYREEDGKFKANDFPAPEYKVGYFPRASGSIYSNVIDMSKWITMHLDKGMYKGKRFISESVISEMHKPQVVTPQSPYSESVIKNRSYGLGWSVDNYRGFYRVNHSGGTMGFSTQVFMFPQNGLGIVVLTNKGSGLPAVIAYYASDLFLGLEPIAWNESIKPGITPDAESKKEAKLSKPPRKLSEYAGEYEHPAGGRIFITAKGDKLYMKFHLGDAGELEHVEYDIFKQGNLTISFFANAKWEITHLTAPFESTVDPIRFDKMK